MSHPTSEQYKKFNEQYELIETVRDLIAVYRLNFDDTLHTNGHLTEVDSTHIDDIGDDAYALYTINDKDSGDVVMEVTDIDDVLEFILNL